MLLPWLERYQQQLSRLLATQQLAHGILLTGPSGIGKHQLAQYLVASLLCTAKNKPCGECKSCLLFAAGSHADFLAVDNSGTTIGIDAVRQLSQFMQGRPQQQPNKVVLVSDADKLTEAAANALLKTLEEPPQNSFIILYCNSANALPATVMSRCQQWQLAAEFGDDAKDWLRQQTNRAVPDFLLTYCGGGPLKALALLESGAADQLQVSLQHLTQYLQQQLSLTECVKQLEQSEGISQLLGWFLRQQLVPSDSQNPQRLLAMHMLYNRWCRDDSQILGQNKQLALSAFLTELKRLHG